jgi:hypothetical protein
VGGKIEEMVRLKRGEGGQEVVPIAHVINCDAIIDRPVLHLDPCPDISCAREDLESKPGFCSEDDARIRFKKNY